MTKIIGHRGARGLAPENTLAAIDKALANGADMIEIDVRVSSDGVPVLSHGKSLAGHPRLHIREHSYQALQAARPDLPTLDEAVRHVKRRVPLMLEVKPGVAIGPFVATLRDALRDGWQPNDFLLGSKSQRILVALHHALPAIDKVVIERFLSVRAVSRAKQVGTRTLAMNQHFVWFGFVSAMHRRGYKLFVYTLNNPAKAKRWQRRGLAGVVTDHPELFASHTQNQKRATNRSGQDL